jgi:hypothetical protein
MVRRSIRDTVGFTSRNSQTVTTEPLKIYIFFTPNTPFFHLVIFTAYPSAILRQLSHNPRAALSLSLFASSYFAHTQHSLQVSLLLLRRCRHFLLGARDASFQTRQLKIYNLGSFIYTHTLFSAPCLLHRAIFIVDSNPARSPTYPRHNAHPLEILSETRR